MSNLTSEQSYLLTTARSVWERRAAAKQAGLPFNEETITETLLLDMQQHYPGDVSIVPFTKSHEAETGADWLWSFISADSAYSQTMLVQAKRLANNEASYPGLYRLIGKRTPKVRQIDQLLGTAHKYGVPALYAFYNHVSDTTRIPEICETFDPGDANHVFGFGISLAEASTVARANPNQQFDLHKRHSVPLHCLLCNGGRSTPPEDGSPAMASNGLRRIRSLNSKGETTREVLGFREGLHPVVELALAAQGEGSGTLTKKLGAPGIAGVVVFQDTKSMSKLG